MEGLRRSGDDMSPSCGQGIDYAESQELQDLPCLNFILAVIENH